MRRVIYQVVLTNNSNSLNRAAQAYCKKFEEVEFPHSNDFTVFLKNFSEHIDSLNRKYPRCTPLAVKASASGKSISVVIPERVDANVARMYICFVTATYTTEYGYVNEIKLVERKGGEV